MERMEALAVLRLEGRPSPSDVEKAFRNREYEIAQKLQNAPEEGLRVSLNFELQRIREAQRVLSVPEVRGGASAAPGEPRASTGAAEPGSDTDTVQLSLPPLQARPFAPDGASRLRTAGAWVVRVLALLSVLAALFIYLTRFGPLEDWWRETSRDSAKKAEAMALKDEGRRLAGEWDRTAGLLRVKVPVEIESARKALERGDALFAEGEDAQAITAYLEAKGRYEVGLEQLREIRTQLRAQGQESAVGIRNLFKEIEKAEWGVDRRERDASEEVERIKESLKIATSREERRRIEEQLAEARNRLGLARDIQTYCRRFVFENERLPEIDGEVAKTVRELQEEDVYRSLETLERLRKELEGLLSVNEELDRTIVELWAAEQLLEQLKAPAEENERELLKPAEEKLTEFRAMLEKREFQAIREGLPALRSSIEITRRMLPRRRELRELANRLRVARTFPELLARLDRIEAERRRGDEALLAGQGEEAEKAYAKALKDFETLELMTREALLDRARSNLGKEENRITKEALADLLRLDPLDSDALALRKKLSGSQETRVIVVPDDVQTIQAAIQAAKAGETVRIQPGVYEGGIVFKDGIRLEGAGADRVVIRCGAKENNVIKVRNCRSGVISGVTLEHVGSDLDDHRFSGLHIENSSIQVNGVTTRNAAGNGILVNGGGNTTITDCALLGSGWFGIYFAKRGGGSALGNIASRNSFSGIAVASKGVPVSLRRNQCRNNGLHGIYFGEGSTGLADNNVAERNRGSGIAVRGEGAKPTVTANECRNNLQFGIYFDSGAGGAAERNLCTENEYSGIAAVGSGPDLLLRKNRCVGNRRDGIYLSQGARGTAEANLCERNEDSGIAAIGTHPSLVLRGNRCQSNKTWGIYFGGRAGGRAEENVCERNTRDGIAVAEDGTTATLAGNISTANRGDGIHFAKGAGGSASRNICEKNGGYGIYADIGSSARVTSSTVSGNELGDLGGKAKR